MVSIAAPSSRKQANGSRNPESGADSMWRKNICKEDWQSVCSGEVASMTCVAQARAGVEGLHMLVKFEKEGSQQRQGEGVVALQEAAAALGVPVCFVTTLVSGGRRMGVVKGEVLVRCKQGRV